MTSVYRKIFLVLVLALIPAMCFAQKRIYTRKLRLQDFPGKTTKVVLGTAPQIDSLLESEADLRWYASAFEFCTKAEYESLKNNSSFYFLIPTESKGTLFLSILKGGARKSENPMEEAMDVVKIPVRYVGSGENDASKYLGVWIDILQFYMNDAIFSEKVAYNGLKVYNRLILPKNNDVVKVKAGPGEVVFSAETHELLRIKER